MVWEKVHEETEGIYKFTLFATPEDSEPDWDFGSEEEKRELFRKINDGIVIWVCFKVEGSVNDVVLGNDFLGGCCYDSVNDFVVNDGYYNDMKTSSKNEALETIKKLKQIAT